MRRTSFLEFVLIFIATIILDGVQHEILFYCGHTISKISVTMASLYPKVRHPMRLMLASVIWLPSDVVDGYLAITLGAGVQWYEAYDAVQAQGRIVVGGLSLGGSIGAAGGWVAGGGHSTCL